METWLLLVLLLSLSPRGAAKAPIASGVCPKGFFRNATLLFPCDTRSGVAYAPLSKEEEYVMRVPTGVQDLKLKVEAKFPMMIAYRDPLAAVEIPWVRDGEKSDDWKGLSMQLDAGQVISDKTGVWSGFWRVGLNFIGTSQAELDVMVKGVPEGGKHELSDISFEYAAYHGCRKPTVPTGCSDFARFASRQLVFNWSSWAQATYPSGDEAWRELCEKTMQQVASLESGPVPYYMFGEVWGKWPLANKVHPGWREAFRFFDTLGGTPPDGYVDPVEFRTGYGLASTYLSMFGWCEILRKQYGTWKEAWKALSGQEFGMGSPVDFKKWGSSFWNTYTPEGGMSKATADESFVYADADGNEIVTEKEFESIYFSCAPENQGKPPGGQAAEAEKEEEKEAKEDKAAAKKGEGIPIPAAPATRCLYEDIEYSGRQAGAVSRTHNVTECQVNCRDTPGCAHFTFLHHDGTCKVFGLDALWLSQPGAVSGPARCVAQVRMMLEDLDLAKLETQKDILQVELAMELAKAANIPVHDIRDLQGQLGKVSLSTDPSAKGKLIMDSYVDIPAGDKLQEVERLAAHSGANQRLREALQADMSAANAEMQVLVEAIPNAQCFVLGTKLQPALAELATALTARACQNMCQRTTGCVFFSYLKESQQCSLHAGDAKPIFFESSIAGPRECQGLPAVYEPSADEMEVTADGGSIFTSLWFWVILLLLLAALVALYCFLRRPRFWKKSKGRQVSRHGQDAKIGEQKYQYMPLPADQQLEQDMVSQAASDAAWQQLASHGPPQAPYGPPQLASHGPSQTPSSDLSPISGRGGWNGNAGGYGGQWPRAMPPLPQMPPGIQGQMPSAGWQGAWQSHDENWMPHFLGAEAVMEYDAWRAQRQRPERSSWPQAMPQFDQNAVDFPHAYSLPAQPGPLQGNLGGCSFRSEPRVT